MPGIQPRMRATEPFRRSVCQKHFDGISPEPAGRMRAATIERWFLCYPSLLARERISPGLHRRRPFCGFAPLVQLGNTRYSWRQEVASLWRFTRKRHHRRRHTKMKSCSAKLTDSEISTTTD
jgi:hypothetical protein